MIRIALVALPLAVALTAGLASAQEEAIAQRAERLCDGCHGEKGNSMAAVFPVLAGQTARYLYLQLKDYKDGRRKNLMMNPVAEELSKKEMQEFAAYYAAQKPKGIAFRPDPKRSAEGKERSAQILCTMCHLGGFSGQNEIPRVAGQYPEYIAKQLKDFRSRSRTNDAGTMTSVSRTLTDADIRSLSEYIAGL